MRISIQHILSLLIFCSFISNSSFGQTKQDSIVKEATFLILRNQPDSALAMLNQVQLPKRKQKKGLTNSSLAAIANVILIML